MVSPFSIFLNPRRSDQTLPAFDATLQSDRLRSVNGQLFFVRRENRHPPMIPVVLGVAAALAVLLLVSLVARAAIGYRRKRSQRRESHRLARAQSAGNTGSSDAQA